MNTVAQKSNWATGARAGGAMAVVGAVASFGAQNMGTQASINNFTRSMGVMGMSNYTARNFAFGANGRNGNALSQNAADAAGGGGILAAVGNYNAGGARFSAAQSMTSAIGVTNPGLGFAGSAQTMANLYNPATSMSMLSMGYRAQPLRIGGGTSNAAQLAQSLLSRQQPKGNRNGVFTGISSSSFNTSYGANGVGTMDLNQIPGMDSAAMTPMLAAYNTAKQKGISDKQFNKDMLAASKGNQKAVSKYGISASNVIAAQGAQAASTSMQGDISGSFTNGLTTATAGLTKFRNAIDWAVQNVPMANTGVGFAAGGLGGLHNYSNPKNMLAGAGGLVALAGVKKFAGGGMLTTGAAIAAGATPVAIVAGQLSGGLPGLPGGMKGADAVKVALTSASAAMLASAIGAAVDAGIGNLGKKLHTDVANPKSNNPVKAGAGDVLDNMSGVFPGLGDIARLFTGNTGPAATASGNPFKPGSGSGGAGHGFWSGIFNSVKHQVTSGFAKGGVLPGLFSWR